MPALDQEDGTDEPNASIPTEGEDKVKSIEEKQPLDPVSVVKQNEMTPNGSKRKRKDWRAFASENGGTRRRFLRSDMARLLAQTEAGTAKGSAKRFNPAELEGVDWVACGDDLKITNGKVRQIKANVNKDSNKCDIGSESGKAAVEIDETGNLGNGELGLGEGKEGKSSVIAVAGSDSSAGNVVEELNGTKGKEGNEILDETRMGGTADSRNGEELEVKGKRSSGDEVTARAMSDKSGNEQIECATGEVYAPSENSKEGIEIETAKVEAGFTDMKDKGQAEAEEVKNGDKQFNVLNGVKKKGLTTRKRTPVQVESVIVERRITRSSVAKKKENDGNDPETGGAKVAEGLIEEEASGTGQSDKDDDEPLKNMKLEKQEKNRFYSRKRLDLTDSDEDFTPVRDRVRKKKVKIEEEKDDSVSSDTKGMPLSKRKKSKMNKGDSDEEFKVAKRRGRPKKPEVESEQSDSMGSRLEMTRKKKKLNIDSDEPDSDSELLGSNQETSNIVKQIGRPPGSKNKSQKVQHGKMTKKKKKRRGRPPGFKNKEMVVKVESLSELADKPRKVAKEIICGMIKDLLHSHGWTIQMRPRNGRNYLDQVHVSPKGTTHWSITKAYYAFLEEMESSERTDFKPIPGELLSLLKRTVCNVRSDTKKKNKLKGKKKEKGRWLQVKSIKIKKKEKIKKRNKKGREEVSDGNETDGGPGSTCKKSNRGRVRKKKARLTLLARGSHNEGEVTGENEYVPYQWKRTILSWLIDLEVVSDNGKIKYIDEQEPDLLAEGKISRDGIECGCCMKIFTVSDFGVHAGAEDGVSCLSYLFVEETGVCLLQCLIRAWEKQCAMSEPKGFFPSTEADGVDQNDDTCGVCGDGGDLVCCDECPSTFHLGCLGMEMLPSGEWHCPYCSCAFCTKLSSSPLLSCTQCNDRCTCY